MNTRILATALVCALASMVAAPSATAATDIKTVSPAVCTPVGPGTTFSELTFTSNGIFNPGMTNETVLCELPADGDAAWSNQAGLSAKILVHYRAGAEAGRVSCTAYSGSTIVNSGATYGLTYVPPYQQAGVRQHFYIDLAEASGMYTGAPPSNVLCIITPKAALGTIFFQEYVTTSVP